VVVVGCDEDLALSREAPPRPRVLDAVEVALEAETIRVRLLDHCPPARADRAGRTGSEPGGEVGLPHLASEQLPADEGIYAVVRYADSTREIENTDGTRRHSDSLAERVTRGLSHITRLRPA